MQRIIHVFSIVAFFATVAMTMGCSHRYVPVHHYHETEHVKVKRDSVHNTDTIRIAERGDTVLMEVVKWRTRYKTVTDTLVKVDTVQLSQKLISKPEQKTKKKERFRFPYEIVILLIVTILALRKSK